MILEICANSYKSAINAQRAGAHRIELCEDLSVGGVTPNEQTLAKVLEELSIPVFVLVRPRSGDFNYSDEEFHMMLQTIDVCKAKGCSGIVAGVLNTDRTIDEQRTKTLIEHARPLAFTFHRAFDEVIDPKTSLEILIRLGVDRILTSGQEAKAIEGLPMLKALNQLANEKLIIMPGSGINPNNALNFKKAGFIEIHGSASKLVNGEKVSDIDTIKAILHAI